MSLSTKRLMSPEECLNALWAKIPQHIRTTFFSALVWGLLAHLYMFTKKLLNHDDIGDLFYSNYGTPSGRWFLPTLFQLDGNFSAPWLLGVLSLVMIAVAACFVVSTMRLKRPLSCILTAGIMVTYPTVTATMAYMFTADAYFCCLALACFAAYITNKYRFGFLAGIAAIALSMGVYQSYFGVAAVLMVGILILETLDGAAPVQKLVLKGVRFVATLGAGMAVYMVMVKITTRSVELVDYMGISSMGRLSLSDLPRQIVKAYLEYGNIFIQNKFAAHFSFLNVLFLLTGLATLCLAVVIIRRRKLTVPHLILLVLLAAVYPLAGNIVYVMVPNAPIHTLMLYGTCTILLAPLALAGYCADLFAGEAPNGGAALRALCCWVIAVTMGLTAYSYTIFSNEAYLKMDLTYEQTYSFSTRLLRAVEGADGYTPDLPIVLVGRALENGGTPATPELDRIALTGVFSMNDMVNSYTYGHYLRRFHGVRNTVFSSDTPIAQQFGEREDVAALPDYPNSDSIRVLDGYLVVKLS